MREKAQIDAQAWILYPFSKMMGQRTAGSSASLGAEVPDLVSKKFEHGFHPGRIQIEALSKSEIYPYTNQLPGEALWPIMESS